MKQVHLRYSKLTGPHGVRESVECSHVLCSFPSKNCLCNHKLVTASVLWFQLVVRALRPKPWWNVLHQWWQMAAFCSMKSNGYDWCACFTLPEQMWEKASAGRQREGALQDASDPAVASVCIRKNVCVWVCGGSAWVLVFCWHYHTEQLTVAWSCGCSFYKQSLDFMSCKNIPGLWYNLC